MWKSTGVRRYWETLTLQIPILTILFPGLDFIGVFVFRNTHLIVETRLDELKGFYDVLEEDIVELHNCIARTQSLEQIIRSDWYHVNHQGN